jgi:hypothetical protein
MMTPPLSISARPIFRLRVCEGENAERSDMANEIACLSVAVNGKAGRLEA